MPKLTRPHQNWGKEKNKGQNKLRTYCKLKKDHKQENYLTTIATSDAFGTSSYD
jgi:hypothetical protein